MERIVQDVRFALRSLRRAPAFTAVVLVTLALAIGANTAIFSLVNAVILQPLRYPQPERLMYLTTQFPTLGFDKFWVSPPEYLEFRELNRSFSAVGAFATGEVNLTAGDRALRARSASVDEHLLNALALQPAAGRFFAAGETDVSGGPPTPGQPPPAPPRIAILSHALWQRAFGAQPIVGKSIEVDGVPREVIGIMPPGADLMDTQTEIWLPLGLNRANRQNRGNHFLYVIGRLKAHVSPNAAAAELKTLVANWGERVGITARPGGAGHLFSPLTQDGGHILQMTPLSDEVLGTAARSIWVLQAAVAVVLLIACANLGNLMLARAEARHHDLAVITALGAGQGRLVRQFVTEGLLFAIPGGALGLVVAYLGLRALVRGYPGTLPRTGEVQLDLVVLLFAFAVSTVTGVLFGLAPMMHTRAKGLLAALREGGSKGSAGTARHHVRRALIVAEVALAVILVVGAGLLVRTVFNLTSVDAGFDRSHLITFSMTLPRVSYPQPAARMRMYQGVLRRLREMPGVQSATAMSGLPPARPLNANDTDIDNYTAPPQGPFENVDYYQNVMSDYFETMGIPMVHGRPFQQADAASQGRVAVVNETLANTFWKGQNPIGQRLRPCCGAQIPWYTVVGVAKDVKQGGVDQKTGTEFYLFVEQAAGTTPETMNVVLRTTAPPSTLAQTINQVVADTDRSVPVVRLREMNEVFAESIRRPRLLAELVAAFAGLALLLAAIGTYSVLSYIVAERRREIAIRMALGADRVGVVAKVIRDGLTIAAVGLAAGLAGAVGLNRLFASLLFGVPPTDLATLITVAATVALVAVVASSLPAWRASRFDPKVVLRAE